MNTVLGIILCIVAVILVIVGSAWRRKIILEEYEKFREPENSYTLFINRHDWGCAVDRIFINAGDAALKFTKEDLDPEKFSVTVRYISTDPDNRESAETTRQRFPVRAYFCDIDGNEYTEEQINALTEQPSDGKTAEAPHIALEFVSAANEEAAKPFEEGKAAGNIRQKDPYEYEIIHEKFMQPINVCYDWISPQE